MIAAGVRGRVDLARAFLRDIRSPDWGLAGQGIRFALAGTMVAGVYICVTTVLHLFFSLPFQVALAIGFIFSVTLHFTLQRVFVWRHRERFALAIPHQAVRYLLMCGVQYGLTALSTSQLPALLQLPVEVIYVATMLLLAALNFLIFRGRVFHSGANISEVQGLAVRSMSATSTLQRGCPNELPQGDLAGAFGVRNGKPDSREMG